MNSINLSHRSKLIIFAIFAAITLSMASLAINLYINHYHNGKVVKKIETTHSVSPSTIAIDKASGPEQMITAFYSDYIKNKSDKPAQKSLISSYTTTDFAKKSTDSNDLIICSSDYPQTVGVVSSYVDIDTKKTTYVTQFVYDSGSSTANVQIQLEKKADHYLISSVYCSSPHTHPKGMLKK